MIRLAFVVEDGKFIDFLRPACRKIAEQQGKRIELVSEGMTNGCQRRRLEFLCRQASESCDILVVGADAAGERHHRKRSTYRQKIRSLRRIVQLPATKVSYAVAEPCIEAWIISQPTCFAQGLEEALERPFLSPGNWPQPRNEGEAKAALGRLVKDGTGGNLPRYGFEYAEQIVGHMIERGSTNRSLIEWVQEFENSLA